VLSALRVLYSRGLKGWEDSRRILTVEKNKKSLIREYAEAILIAFILALFIRTYFIQAFKIPSGSMIPTLVTGDHILVNKFIYGTKIPFSDKRFLIFKSPEKGDIIVFKYPENTKKDFIKRVIATAGDVVKSQDKVIFINGRKLVEPYVQNVDSFINPGCPSQMVDENNPCHRDNFGPLVVPQGSVFVMGDNRDSSYDSRYWGFVDMKYIIGKALIIYWSWDYSKKLFRLNRIGRLIK
jgi:signal peptidase I